MFYQSTLQANMIAHYQPFSCRYLAHQSGCSYSTAYRFLRKHFDGFRVAMRGGIGGKSGSFYCFYFPVDFSYDDVQRWLDLNRWGHNLKITPAPGDGADERS